MNKMSNFNGMPYKRSARAGGKSVSMVGMLVLLLAALLVLPSCTGDDTEVPGPTVYLCEADGSEVDDKADCPPVEPDPMYDMVRELEEGECHVVGDGDGRVKGNPPGECISGGSGDDIIKGEGGADAITGGDGDDKLYGGDGNDKLNGGDGNDKLNGGDGNDELTGGRGNNTLDGGGGEDFAIFLGARRVTVDLDAGEARVEHVAPERGDGYLSLETKATDSGTGSDTLENIENVKGTHGKDMIDGDENPNVLKGLDEADIINGKGGNDMILPNRPPEADAMGMVANVANTAATPAEVDGIDVVDGGKGNDTISYEGEGTTVTVNLGTIVAAVEDDQATTDTDESAIAHVAATVAAGDVTVGDDTSTVLEVIDMIKVVLNEATEDDDDLVSTIENVTGGFGDDALTGDAGDNKLSGGAGNDTLSGAAGNDMLMGGAGNDNLSGGAGSDTLIGGPGTETDLDGNAGDDTYMGVEADENGNVSEVANEGNDTLYYAAPEDDADTADTDESESGVGESGSPLTTPANVETVFGTQNADYLTAATGATVLGLGGDDTLTAANAGSTLVGCAGKNTLRGDAGNDTFGVYKDGTNADTIQNFTTGTGMAVTDEIHLKGFGEGTVKTALIPGNSEQAGVYVDNVLVAQVSSTAIVAITSGDNPKTPDVVETNYSQSRAQSILDALGKSNTAGMSIVRTVTFTPDKCM